jgi:5'-nucleotidase
MHGYLEGERLKGSGSEAFEFGGIVNAMGTVVRLKQEASNRTIILDDGDFWQGTFASNRDEGKAIVAAMNIVGYDALTLGNHDFDHGVEVVKARASEAKFPFLAANLIEQATSKPPAWVKPYIIKEVAGIRFGIIGLTNSGTPAISSKASELQVFKFVNEVDALKQILPEVKGKSDLIIVLSHNGLDREEQLAREVPGIDVVISGHSHAVQNQSKLVGNAIVVHAGYKAQFVGRLELKVNPATKKIVDYTRAGEAVAAVSNKATPPQEVVDLFGKLLNDARAAINRPIGETLIDLNRVFTNDGRSTGEYPLGNIVVDAMLAANQAGDRRADIAIHNNAGIRTDIPKGPITYGKLYEVLPFDNVLTAMDLKGEHIKAVLEVAASCPRVNTLVAGMSFVYDCSKPPGNRISKIMIQGKPMEPQRVYRVQTIDYLAGGGDGQMAFKEGANLAYGDAAVDVVADYIRKNSPLNPQVEGRIVEAKK